MKHPLVLWKNCVEYLETNEYTSADEAELVNDISCRSNLEKMTLSPKEKQELERIDNRFREVIIAALEQSKLLKAYRYWAKSAPENYWWWHVEER